MRANFTVVSSSIPLKTKIIGNLSDSQIFSGTITKYNEYNGLNEPVVGAKITATSMGTVVDFDFTRSDGTYYLYLETGIYDIRIEHPSYSRVIRNYEVKRGIKEYKEDYLSGRVKNKELDTTYFCGGGNKKLITGKIVDEHGKPSKDIDIIVVVSKENKEMPELTTKKLRVFTKTNSVGDFSFILDSVGPYDVILRSKKSHAQVIKNYKFSNDGFFHNIVFNNLTFNERGEWIWISN
jgi:hypothetical protein